MYGLQHDRTTGQGSCACTYVTSPAAAAHGLGPERQMIRPRSLQVGLGGPVGPLEPADLTAMLSSFVSNSQSVIHSAHR
jgi:hypothetical protein